MDRDWDAEEAALRAKATEAFECLMGVRVAGTEVQTRRGEITAMYVAEEAREAYQKARDELDAFLDERRATDPSAREV